MSIIETFSETQCDIDLGIGIDAIMDIDDGMDVDACIDIDASTDLIPVLI